MSLRMFNLRQILPTPAPLDRSLRRNAMFREILSAFFDDVDAAALLEEEEDAWRRDAAVNIVWQAHLLARRCESSSNAGLAMSRAS